MRVLMVSRMYVVDLPGALDLCAGGETQRDLSGGLFICRVPEVTESTVLLYSGTNLSFKNME